MLRFMGSQRVEHDRVTELNLIELIGYFAKLLFFFHCNVFVEDEYVF